MEAKASSPEAEQRGDHDAPATDRPRDRVVELLRVPATQLASNPARWKEHTNGQRRVLRELLRRIGFAGALVARRTEGGLVVLDGHLRKDLAADVEVPVLVVDLDAEEADLFLATYDPVGELATAADGALAELVRRTAVPEELVAALHRRYGAETPRAGLTDPDDVPERPRRSRVSPGEVWALGKHRVGCGDATDPPTLRRLVGEGSIDVVFTDPPYGVGYVGKTADALTIANDEADGLRELLERGFAATDGVLAPGARLYVCHPAGPASATFAQAFIGAGWRWHQTLVWVKDRIVVGHADYHYRHEQILYGYKLGAGRWGRGHRGWFGGNDADSVLEVSRPAASRDHPTTKPVELITRCLRNSSAPGDRVLDPFGGSGSTLIAAERLGRACSLLEIDPVYCEVAISRWEAFTGREAVRVDG